MMGPNYPDMPKLEAELCLRLSGTGVDLLAAFADGPTCASESRHCRPESGACSAAANHSECAILGSGVVKRKGAGSR